MIDSTKCLEELHRRKYDLPFVPFEIETVGGGRFEVRRRMAFAATDRTIIVLDRQEHSHRVPISKVKSIRSLLVNH